MPLTDHRHARLLLLLVCVAHFLLVADLAVVHVALPTIRETYDASQRELQWVSGIYALCFGGFLLVGGRAADALGRRRVFVSGLAVFGAATLACGLAPSMELLIAGRALQGLAAAFVAPAGLALVTTVFAEPGRRRRALVTWTTTGFVGATAGYVVGGLATAVAGWQAALLVQAPLAALLIAAVLRLASGDAGRAHAVRVNAAAAAVATAALVALIYGLTSVAERAWLSGHVLGPLVLAVALACAFAWLERRRPGGLVPRALTRERTVRSANVLSLLLGATGAAFFFTTQYIQDVLGHGPLAASLLLMVVPVSLIVGTRVGVWLVAHAGTRNAITIGFALLATGLLVLSRVPADGSFLVHVVPGSLLFGIGRGFAIAPVTATAIEGVEASVAGVASGLVNTAGQVGFALGLAVLVTASSLGGTGAAACQHAFLAAAVLALAGVVVASRTPLSPRT